jgi:type II secretory pathway component GspD/PulD (secretin)
MFVLVMGACAGVTVEVYATDPSPERQDPRGLLATEEKVTLPDGFMVLDAVQHIMKQISYGLNYLELVPPEKVKLIQGAASTFFTDTPLPWQLVLREVITPHGLDYIEDGEVVRIGSEANIDERRELMEQERLRRNRSRISVNFSDGIRLYMALRAIQSSAGINMNFDYMAPEDRGIEPVRQVGEDKEARPAGRQTTYATPDGQPVEWRVIMREVLNPFGYDFAEIGGVVRPARVEQVRQWERQLVDDKPLATRIVRIYHMNPAQLIARVQAMGLIRHSKGSLQIAHGWDADSRSKAVAGGLGRHTSAPAVMVRDIDENMENILREIKALDTREQQIMIEIRILDLGRKSTRELGMKIDEFGGGVVLQSGYSSSYEKQRAKSKRNGSELTWGRDIGRTVDSGGGSTASSASGSGVSSSSGWTKTDSSANTYSDSYTDASSEFGHKITSALRSSAWGRGFDVMLTPFQMRATWSMLQNAQDAKLVSQPVLVVPDHGEAVFRVQTEVPYAESSTTSPRESETVVTDWKWQTLNVGIRLNVIPEITADGKSVRLSVLPVVTELVDYEPAPAGSQISRYPIVSTRELDTRVTVVSRHTLLMGGLMKANATKQERKVPFLGDMPLIGWLFRWKSRDGDQSNLVMLITPTILDGEVPNTGYEADVVPHFEKMKMDMRAALREGMDESTLQTVEEKALRALQPVAVEVPTALPPVVDRDIIRRIEEAEAWMLDVLGNTQ